MQPEFLSNVKAALGFIPKDAELKLAVPLDFVRNPRARSYILRLTDQGIVRVTIPLGGSIAEAVRFVIEHADWIACQRALQTGAQRDNARWTAGSRILFRGAYCTIDVVGDDRERRVVFGNQSIPIPPTCTNLRPLVEGHLKQLAAREIPPRVIELAASASLPLKKVVVRDQRSRWGSCSRLGTVSLNWRLVQTPGWVCDYLIWHELMHLREMRHSGRFWDLVAFVCPYYKAAEDWIRQKSHEIFYDPAPGSFVPTPE